nr:solute carrier family 22 member 7-like [Rhipicephalus microplus]
MTSPTEKAGSGQGTPPQSVLDGFATATDARLLIQENIYVCLGNGKFQQMVLMCSLLCFTVLVLHAFAYRLIGRPVDHWCHPPEELVDMPLQEWKNVAIPILPDGQFSQCTVYEPPVPGEDKNEHRQVVSCRWWDYERQGDSIVSAWNLVCGRRWLYTLSTSAYMVGAMVIVPLAGIVADRHGRRPTILLCSFTMLLASMAAALSQVFTMFLLARCLVAGTSSATGILVFIVLYEVTGNEHRTLYSILATTISAASAPPLLSIVALADPHWWLSHAFLVTTTALVATCCYYAIEESPVWLIDIRRVRLAERVLLRAAAQNGIDLAKAKATFKLLKTQLEKRDSATPTISTGTGTNKSTFSRQAVSVLISWFGVNFAFYATGLRKKTISSEWAMTAFVLQILLVIVIYNVIMKWGQRNALSMLLALLCLASALRAFIRTLNIPFPAAAIARLIVDNSASVAIAINYCYTTEVFPTGTRSMGLCVSYAVGRAGALLATLLDSLMADNLVVVDLVMTLLVFASATAIQWLPAIFIRKKKTDRTPQLTPDTEQQRKEALKASLNQGREPMGASFKTRKSRRRTTQSSGPTDVSPPSKTLSPASAPSPTTETVASPRSQKHSKRSKSGVSSEVASPPSQSPISQ